MKKNNKHYQLVIGLLMPILVVSCEKEPADNVENLEEPSAIYPGYDSPWERNVIEKYDPNFVEIQGKGYSSKQVEYLWDRRRNLSGEGKVCVDNYIRDYEDKVLAKCIVTGMANIMSGGCYHYYQLGFSDAYAAEKAMLECNINLEIPLS